MLEEAYKTRKYAVDFFTVATGPTVLENRLASRIPLRQLYRHTIEGKRGMGPALKVDQNWFNPKAKKSKKSVRILTNQPWRTLYYMGAYDGDLMAGWSTGRLDLPYHV